MGSLLNENQQKAFFLNDQIRCLRDQCLHERSSLEAIKLGIELLKNEKHDDPWRPDRLLDLQNRKAAAIDKIYKLTKAWALADRDLKVVWSELSSGGLND